MPQATDELRAEFPGWDSEALAVLETNFTEEKGVFRKKDPSYQPTKREGGSEMSEIIGADARAYAHKCIERVTEMRKLDLERAKEANAVDVDYYLGRAHRCDDILFWLGEYESHIEAGLSATED